MPLSQPENELGSKSMLRTSSILLLAILSSGCWNADYAREIDFGDISIGVQLMDLKRALDEEAITPDEYATIKQAIIDALANDPLESEKE